MDRRRDCRTRGERPNAVQRQRLQPAQPKQVAAVHAPSKCTRQTSSGSGSTDYFGTWGNASGPRLSVSVDALQSTTSSGFKLANQHLGQLPNAKEVSGVGSLAWESSRGTVTMVNFVVGHDVCNSA